MKLRITILFFLGLLSVASTLAQDNGKNQWVLRCIKVLKNGDLSDDGSTGIAMAKERAVAFGVQHYRPAGFSYGGGKIEELNAHHVITSTWSKLPQYINVGEENKVVLEFKNTLDAKPYNYAALAADRYMTQENYEIGLNVNVTPEVKARGKIFGFTKMKQVLDESKRIDDMNTNLGKHLEGFSEKELDEIGEAIESYCWEKTSNDEASGRLACGDKWELPANLGDDAYLMIAVNATLAKSTTAQKSKYSVLTVYLYSLTLEEGYWEQTKTFAGIAPIGSKEPEKYRFNVYEETPYGLQIKDIFFAEKKIEFTNSSLGDFNAKENYQFHRRSASQGQYTSVFNIKHTEPRKYYGAGESVMLTFSTTTSVPKEISDYFRDKIHITPPITPLTIEGGITYSRHDTRPLTSNQDATLLRNLADQHNFCARKIKDDKWVDINENVSGPMPHKNVSGDKGEMPERTDNGDIVYIRIDAYIGEHRVSNYYQYEWRTGKMPTIVETDNVNTNKRSDKDIPGEWIWVPTVVFIGGGAGIWGWKRVKPFKNYREKQKETIKKFGTSDPTALKKILKQNMTTDVVEGYQHGIESDVKDQQIIVLETTADAGFISLDCLAAYATGGESVKWQMAGSGGVTFLKTVLDPKASPKETIPYKIFKGAWKGGWDAVKTGVTGGKGEIAKHFTTKFIYGNMIDIVGNIPEMAEGKATRGKVFSMFVKNGINSGVDLEPMFGKKAAPMGEKLIENATDKFFDFTDKK